MVVAGVGKVVGRCSDVGDILCCSGSGGTSLRLVDVGYVSTHWEDTGRFPPSCGPQTTGTAAEEEAVWDVGPPLTGGGNDRGGHTGGEGIR